QRTTDDQTGGDGVQGSHRSLRHNGTVYRFGQPTQTRKEAEEAGKRINIVSGGHPPHHGQGRPQVSGLARPVGRWLCWGW
ncbi:MAG: hypothetical protein O3B13_06565, partial [Planctomycetota bacterium]|nr:hypothetical protein [Planctomycetota bacterium]